MESIAGLRGRKSPAFTSLLDESVKIRRSAPGAGPVESGPHFARGRHGRLLLLLGFTRDGA
jgi:hypothetical protein